MHADYLLYPPLPKPCVSGAAVGGAVDPFC